MIVKVKTPLSPCHRPWNLEQKKLKDPRNLLLTMFLISNKPSSVKILSPNKRSQNYQGYVRTTLCFVLHHRSRNECPSTCNACPKHRKNKWIIIIFSPFQGDAQQNPSAISGTFIESLSLKMFRKSLETVNQ